MSSESISEADMCLVAAAFAEAGLTELSDLQIALLTLIQGTSAGPKRTALRKARAILKGRSEYMTFWCTSAYRVNRIYVGAYFTPMAGGKRKWIDEIDDLILAPSKRTNATSIISSFSFLMGTDADM